MLTAEELYLLLTRANGDPEVHGLKFGFGLTSALLTDLVDAGHVAITDDDPPRVTVLSTDLTGTLVLDFGLERIADRDGRRVESVIRWGRFDPEFAVVESLVQSGVLERGARTLMGFGKPRTIQTSPEPKDRVRERLAAVFAGERAPTAGDATIIAALQALTVAPHLLRDHIGASSRRQFEQRLSDLVAEAPLPGGAVARTVFDLSLARMPARASMGVGNRGIGASNPPED